MTPTATVPNKYRNDLTAGACYASGTCKVCRRVAGDDAQKRAEEAAVPAGVEDLRVQFVVTMRCGGFGWEEIVRDLRTKSTALHALLVAAGMLSLAEDLAEYQESRRRKPGLRPPGRPRKVREVNS